MLQQMVPAMSLLLLRLCHNSENAIFVILNPSPCVTLSETKGLGFRLRVNSVKNLTRSVILNEVKDLMGSFAYAQDRLRLKPQNDIVKQSL